MAKVAYSGTGLRWHATPDLIMGFKGKPGVFFDLKLTEVRLYALINWECGQIGKLVVDLNNSRVMEYAKLDKDSLPKTRKALAKRKLVTATKLGRGEVYRYEIIDPQSGWSLPSNRFSPRTPGSKQEIDEDDEDDNWGR